MRIKIINEWELKNFHRSLYKMVEIFFFNSAIKLYYCTKFDSSSYNVYRKLHNKFYESTRAIHFLIKLISNKNDF